MFIPIQGTFGSKYLKRTAGKGNAGALVFEQPLEKDYFGMSGDELFTEAQKEDGQKALDELRRRSIKSKQKVARI